MIRIVLLTCSQGMAIWQDPDPAQVGPSLRLVAVGSLVCESLEQPERYQARCRALSKSSENALLV